jgi:protein-S-isoprenylcysteine O-methyltransferase Ste14
MTASTRQSRLRLLIRHPLLTGAVLWGVSHLLLNGDPPSWSAELVTLLIAAITVAVIIYLHPWLSGIPV